MTVVCEVTVLFYNVGQCVSCETVLMTVVEQWKMLYSYGSRRTKTFWYEETVLYVYCVADIQETLMT